MKKLIGLLIICTFALSSSINDKALKKINKLFPNLKDIKSLKLIVDENIALKIESKVNQKFYYDELHIWKITTNNQKKYTAILDNVKGKSMPITFLAIFNEENDIHNISIIKYREPYGGEIKSERWLKQFIGFNYLSSYIVGSSIDGISGATISTKSISKGINKLSLLLELNDEGALLLD